jgi:glutathione peroxidase
MFEKVVTKKGTGQSPVYAFLGSSGNLPAWNFSKYVVDKQGKIVAFFPSQVTPEDPALRGAIQKALAGS